MPESKGNRSGRKNRTDSTDRGRSDRNERNDAGDAAADPRTNAPQRADDAWAEQLPELSEEGGIEPQVESPAEYHDRTRDRELKER